MAKRVTTPVPHLCPSITAVAKIIRRNTTAGHPDRKEAMKLLRFIQDGIHDLRGNESALHEETVRLRRSLSD